MFNGKLLGMILGLIVAGLTTVQCGVQAGAPAKSAAGEKPKVIATTSLVADAVKQVGGEWIDLALLLPVGTDPHSFEPTPRDLAAVADAQMIFVNGVGLEAFLDEMLKNAGGTAVAVEVSAGVAMRQLNAEDDHAEEAHPDEAEDEHAHTGADPHTWTSPTNVTVWVTNIEQALSAMDPAHRDEYQANAQAYQAKLAELDEWVKTEIASIPPENRKLVTDHAAFGYYADRYGLTQIGAVIPAFSAAAEPSAHDLAVLTDAIKQYQVQAIFVGTTVNPALSKQIADDAGLKLVRLYTGSLGPAGSGVENYLDYTRYNTTAIVEALR